MRKLKGAIPRGLKDHRTRAGVLYRSYVGAKVGRLGTLPADALPWLREAGLLVLALDRLNQETEAARLALNSVSHRQRERLRATLRQLERRAGRLRGQLASAEARLEELAQSRHGDDPLAALLRAGAGRR